MVDATILEMTRKAFETRMALMKLQQVTAQATREAAECEMVQTIAVQKRASKMAQQAEADYTRQLLNSSTLILPLCDRSIQVPRQYQEMVQYSAGQAVIRERAEHERESLAAQMVTMGETMKTSKEEHKQEVHRHAGRLRVPLNIKRRRTESSRQLSLSYKNTLELSLRTRRSLKQRVADQEQYCEVVEQEFFHHADTAGKVQLRIENDLDDAIEHCHVMWADLVKQRIEMARL